MLKLEMFNVPSRFPQPLNIPAMFTELVALTAKLLRLIDVRPVHPRNMLDRSLEAPALKPARLSDVRPVQSWNMLAILVALLVATLEIKLETSAFCSLAQPSNIWARFIAEQPLKLEKSSPLIFLQFWNIPVIFIPLVVLAVSPARVRVVKLVQPSNMLDISVALLALRLARLSDVRLVHPWNIPAMLVALLASKLARLFNDVRAVQSWNNPAIFT